MSIKKCMWRGVEAVGWTWSASRRRQSHKIVNLGNGLWKFKIILCRGSDFRCRVTTGRLIKNTCFFDVFDWKYLREEVMRGERFLLT